MSYKECSECGERLPASINYFHISKAGKYGLTSKCIKCRRKKDIEYKKRNKEKIDRYKKEYNFRNKERLGAYKRIHELIWKNKPKQIYCSICNEEKKLELASIGHTYTRNPKDYLWLCNDCHHLFDRTRGLYVHA